ncbi:GTP-binding protein gtr2 [Rhizoctonia solani AG-1 IB]|uniref:GTP-binding protein n=1 Tax=Thanatephorus cucumeris (strain AG1-IB / isolate 7/3/14) TaxID=1108050 RepID=M5BPK0_THACB|nr:GTP-binding protein gtr2 [Rhizoctonia solani AG-1 IB]
MTSVYDHTTHEAFSRIVQRITSQVHIAALENLMNVLTPNCSMAKSFLFDVNLRIYVATDASPVDPGSYEACSEYVQTILTFAKLYHLSSTLTSPTTPTPQYPSGPPLQYKPEAGGDAQSVNSHDELFPEGEWASSFAQLLPETTLAYWQITGSLALVSLVRSDVFETKRGLIEYNVAFFRDAVQKIQSIVMSGGKPA